MSITVPREAGDMATLPNTAPQGTLRDKAAQRP